MKFRLEAVLSAALFVGPAWAAKPASPPDNGLLQKSVASLGGTAKYQRLETLSYDFLETRQAGSGPRVRRGRHWIKLHDAGGLRVREEVLSPDKTVTLLTSSGAWRWEDGRPVTDPQALARVAADLRQKMFWLFLPHNLAETDCSASYLGLGFLEGKIAGRLKIEGAAPLSAPADSFTLYLDTATFRAAGAVFSPDGGGPQTLFFGAYRATPVLTVPVQWFLQNDASEQTASFQMENLSLNEYVDEALFDPSAPVPAAERHAP